MSGTKKEVSVLNSNVQSLAREPRDLKNSGSYDEFIVWYALPRPERIKLGMETQLAFAEYHGLNTHTLTLWKKRLDFQGKVTALRREWAHERTSNVIAGIYNSAVSGGKEAPQAQKLWMQVFEGFTEKAEVEHTKKIEISVNDIRFLIQGLPEPLRTEHYANLRKLLDDSSAIAKAGLWVEGGEFKPDEGIVEGSIVAGGSEGDIPRETNHDAPNVPSPETYFVARSHSADVCENMERQLQPYNYKSAARWWKEQTAGHRRI